MRWVVGSSSGARHNAACEVCLSLQRRLYFRCRSIHRFNRGCSVQTSASENSLSYSILPRIHDGLIANAGLIVVATLMSRLGLERLANTWVRTGSHAAGRKLCTLITAMLAGATHVDVLRAGATQTVLPFRLMAPSTIGTFLRSSVRIITVLAVAVNRSGQHALRFPADWLWRDDFTTMLENLRTRPGPAG